MAWFLFFYSIFAFINIFNKLSTAIFINLFFPAYYALFSLVMCTSFCHTKVIAQ